jgi:hypothetical protein
VSNWTDDDTMVEGMSPYPSSYNRMSSILPDDMDLYSEPSPPPSPRRRWSIAFPDGQQELILEQEVEEIELGPEVKGTLPVIGEGDFMYYPLPSYVPRVEVDGEGKERKKESKKSIGRWLKRVFGRRV